MKKIWVVIYVYRGLIQEPEIFIDEATAADRKINLLSQINLDYDEVEVFEKVIS